MKRFRYTLHNLVGHPLMEVLWLLRMDTLADWIHDITLPKDVRKAWRVVKELEGGE